MWKGAETDMELCRWQRGINMHIIVNNTSMVPIYEQIMDQIKAAVISGELTEDTMLPSVRGLAKELKISALWK